MAGGTQNIRMPPGWRNGGSFSEIVAATAAFNEGREAQGGHVYFLGSDTGLVKIGFSTKLHSRIRALKGSSATPLQLLAAVPGDKRSERAYHSRFADDRQHGEWFTLSPAILAEIARLNQPTPSLASGPCAFGVAA